VAEVAEYLKANQQTVRNWLDRRELAAVRVGSRRVRIRRSDLDEFLKREEAVAVPPAAMIEPATEAFRDAMRSATAELDGKPEDLAASLRALADAARMLAKALLAAEATHSQLDR
jgi:excisionase family DNA binding protein